MTPSLRYIKFSPAGNTTAFVVDAVHTAVRPALARALIRVLDVEQVGFVVPSENGNRMEMMGGEFCGNASRAFAAFLALGGAEIWEHGPRPVTAATELAIEVSGHSGLLEATVAPGTAALGCRVSIAMPTPLGITGGAGGVAGDYSLVDFEGIRHLVLWEMGPQGLGICQALAERLGIAQGDYGLLFMGGGLAAMTPWVSIAATDTRVWESSCGSGTVAVACALAHRAGCPIEGLTLAQPGGSLTASAICAGGAVTAASLSGEVDLVSWGYV